MGLLGNLRRWFTMEEYDTPRYRPPTWQPISTAPSDEHILLGWSEGDDEFDFLISAGKLHAGQWIDGPGPQPDFWMSEPDLRYCNPISRARDGETLVLIWHHDEVYDFDVGELIDGVWQDGPEQPTGWVTLERPPTGAHISGRQLSY